MSLKDDPKMIVATPPDINAFCSLTQAEAEVLKNAFSGEVRTTVTLWSEFHVLEIRFHDKALDQWHMLTVPVRKSYE